MLAIGSASAPLTIDEAVPQSGFAARTDLSEGTHDPIVVSAVAIGQTCLIALDVAGLDRDFCERVAAALPLDPGGVVVSATHTHAGPAVMAGGLGSLSPQVRKQALRTAVETAEQALADQRPRALAYADLGPQPVATDRRHGGRPAGAVLRALRWSGEEGTIDGWLVGYPCHPTVLGPDNRLLSADYPGFLRAALQRAHPGADVVFATGCAGDLNTGHQVAASYTGIPSPDRTFDNVERIGGLLAGAVMSGTYEAVAGTATSVETAPVALGYAPLDPLDGPGLVPQWRQRQAAAPGHEASVLQAWIDWAQRPDAATSGTWRGSVTVARWGDVAAVFLPGEPFFGVAESIARRSGVARLLCVGYSNGCPGYFPMAGDYPDGGYEVRDAHRYYGMPAPFVPGSAERLVTTAVRMLPPRDR